MLWLLVENRLLGGSGRSKEACLIDGVLDLGTGSGDGEEWLDSGYILSGEPTGFASGDVEGVGVGDIRGDSKAFGLSNWVTQALS